ncbi:AzlD domain-containing protein [Cronobacter dublinensis]|uniref:AzlD domain-containing protein n=1 Tax=Cronobacter dublinensis TaxID=413497 RepID=UPI000CFCE88D|nr:AzlD domain-containing protein [Cronobacter dublinensis]MDK1194243.1 AzlD domain-containing protein [Cronobacter dublinensis]MDK1202929.1 AzlD domain-containing protein [Cronobacter dublinensis]
MSQEIFLLIVIFSMMAVTFAIRLIPLHLSPERTPRFINAVIEYIPAAVISSITIPALFFPQSGGFSLYNASVLAAVPVVLTAWFTKNLIVSVVVGVICQVLASQFLFG